MGNERKCHLCDTPTENKWCSNSSCSEYESENSLCLDCLEKMEIETDIQLCQKCMDNYDTDKLFELHDQNKLDALDFNESAKMREQFRINQ